METRQLQHFLAIADAGTFTSAAERLHISQPGLSSSIRALEHSLGVRLFVRTRKRAELTEAGRELYSGARRALATLDALESQIRRGPGVTQSTLRVGCIPSFAGLDLAALISRFVAGNPDVDVDVVVGMPLRHFADLADETIELAFVTMPLEPPEGIRLTPLVTYPMVLACPVGHRLSKQPSVALADLADEVFVDFDVDLAARQVTDRAIASAGITRTVRVTCNEIGSLLELVAHGLGIAIVPRPLAIATRVPVAMVPLTNASLVWTVAAATRPAGMTTEAGRAFWNLIADTATPVNQTRT
ncbi:LysR family transcriptional regulator [Pseudonocardia sp. EV170527-09]|uniref:LysR family transcriptional regulator n=1 Tax=Pseudonocardia sp. EV170527-09 TaxID=2603411 RepID=UPI0011F15C99|nr:LysR family transcriptional regulator [Pseudonocardia sp. EV170527-09]KAA1022290.1 LysR family transcriptional regulator [Pseudonocardia sp. EV170527-09]